MTLEQPLAQSKKRGDVRGVEVRDRREVEDHAREIALVFGRASGREVGLAHGTWCGSLRDFQSLKDCRKLFREFRLIREFGEDDVVGPVDGHSSYCMRRL